MKLLLLALMFGALLLSTATAQQLTAEDWANKGAAFKDAKKYDKAIEALSKAIEINPKYDGAYVVRGIVYGLQGDHQREIGDYNKAIELNPTFAAVYDLRGVAYEKLGDYKHAIADESGALVS